MKGQIQDALRSMSSSLEDSSRVHIVALAPHLEQDKGSRNHSKYLGRRIERITTCLQI